MPRPEKLALLSLLFDTREEAEVAVNKGEQEMSDDDVKPATFRPWNTDLSSMPTEGRFEVLRVYEEVYRPMPDKTAVIEPYHGRMFTPFAWRRAAD